MSVTSAQVVLGEIRRLHDDRQTGILTLVNRGGERVDLFFREGMIEAASSNSSTYRLGGYLARVGNLHARDLDSAQLEAKRTKIFLGEAVVRKQLLGQAEVGAAVRAQAIDLIDHVFENDFCVDSFATSLRSYYVPARISFPHVLLELSRHNNTLFEPSNGTLLSLSENVDLSPFPWSPEELSVLSQLCRPQTFTSLSKTAGVQETFLERFLGVLQRLKVLEQTLDDSGSPVEIDAIIRKPEFAFEQLIPIVTNAVLSEKLELARAESSLCAEQLKNLKVQIAESSEETPLKVITVSSPEPQDGKSFISTNLAFSFAMDPGRRVVIIDCDLRNPALDRYLGVPTDPGLLQYLGNGHLGPNCYMRRFENLYFITAGGTAPNPIEVLSMHKMKELIDNLRQDFDTIILDAPPYAPISDARIVTGLSDSLIMVIRRGKTSYRSTDRAFKAINPKKLLGVVFNDVQPMMFHPYYDSSSYSPERRLESRVSETRNKNYLKQ